MATVAYRIAVLSLLAVAVMRLDQATDTPAAVTLADIRPPEVASQLGAMGSVPVVFVTNVPASPVKVVVEQINDVRGWSR